MKALSMNSGRTAADLASEALAPTILCLQGLGSHQDSFESAIGAARLALLELSFPHARLLVQAAQLG
eukprot:12972836-Alexandrium_andersonii.AAC.1